MTAPQTAITAIALLNYVPGGANLALTSYFTPFNQQTLLAQDQDVASGGLVVLPDSVGSAAHPHLAVAAGKSPEIYLVDRDNLGGFNPANNSQIVESFRPFLGPSPHRFTSITLAAESCSPIHD